MILIHKKYLISIIVLFSLSINFISATTIFTEVEIPKQGQARLVDFWSTQKNYESFFAGKGLDGYSFEILDKNENKIYSETFNVDFFIINITENERIVQDIEIVNKSFRLFLPEKSYFVNFYRDGEEILFISLSDQICNRNSNCEKENGESAYLCPDECKLETTTTISKTTSTTSTTLPAKKPSKIKWYLLIGIIIVVLVFLFLYQMRKQTEKQSNLQ